MQIIRTRKRLMAATAVAAAALTTASLAGMGAAGAATNLGHRPHPHYAGTNVTTSGWYRFVWLFTQRWRQGVSDPAGDRRKRTCGRVRQRRAAGPVPRGIPASRQLPPQAASITSGCPPRITRVCRSRITPSSWASISRGTGPDRCAPSGTKGCPLVSRRGSRGRSCTQASPALQEPLMTASAPLASPEQRPRRTRPGG